MSSPTFDMWKRMIRDGQPNALSNERLVKLVESGLWDAVVDAPNYRALKAKIESGVWLAPTVPTSKIGATPTLKTERKWHAEEGVIYFSVTSNGMTGEQWIARLEQLGFGVGDYAQQLLCLGGFESTSGITAKIAVVTKKGIFEAREQELMKPNAEVACLIREMFSDEELAAMGLWRIVVMHEPLKDADGDALRLSVRRGGGGLWLDTFDGHPLNGWLRGRGFAYAVA
ncbi:MAG: hypothetical protein Q7R85_03510 [bacterium]|nr:hypothetical protein [bacterium]